MKRSGKWVGRQREGYSWWGYSGHKAEYDVEILFKIVEAKWKECGERQDG